MLLTCISASSCFTYCTMEDVVLGAVQDPWLNYIPHNIYIHLGCTTWNKCIPGDADFQKAQSVKEKRDQNYNCYK